MKSTVLPLVALVLIQAEDLYALRPFISASDAGIAQPGKIEVEAGIGFQRNTRGNASKTTSNLPGTVFNTGLTRNLELDIGTGFNLVREKTEGGKRRTLGSAAETSLTPKLRLFEGEGSIPSVTTEMRLLLPSQRREFLPNGTRSVSFTGVLIATSEIGPLKSHLNLGGGFSKSPKHARDTIGSFVWAIAGELAISEKVWLVAEFRGTSAQRLLPDNTALAGLVWESRWGIKFDIAGFGGLSRGSDNGGVTLGLTFAFEALPWIK
ncbi:MAG: hypothetical protein ACREQA_19475 [Candidatus Binatia bacterium]